VSEHQIGCSNGYCILRYNYKIGQHTNGGCRCLRDLPTPQRIQANRKIRWQAERIAELEAQVLGLRPTPIEFQQAKRIAELESEQYVELNMSNYNDNDVAQLNEWGIWAMGRIVELEAKCDEARECALWLIPFLVDQPNRVSRAVSRWPWLDSQEEGDGE